MRLDKFLAASGVGSRSEVKLLLKQKRITVAGKVVTSPKIQVEADSQVELDHQPVNYQTNYYLLMNKPKGVITATTDKSQRTVIDLLGAGEQRLGLFPVGRLDKDTTGLLLLTTDGELAHRLLAPKKHVSKVYQAKIEGIVTDQTVARFAKPLTLKNGEVTKPAKLEVISSQKDANISRVIIEITEGKYHQVKRMFAAVGMHVLELHRLKMGQLELPADLKPGQYRTLTKEELASLTK